MAGNTPYTGKSVGALLTWGPSDETVPGWKRAVIEETAGPLPEQLDVTDSADSAYVNMEDPMGAKGTAKTSITIEGLASSADVSDTGLFSYAMDVDTYDFTFQAETGATHDNFTITPVLKRRSRPAEFATLVPYTIVLEKEDIGTWIASAS